MEKMTNKELKLECIKQAVTLIGLSRLPNSGLICPAEETISLAKDMYEYIVNDTYLSDRQPEQKT